LEPIVRACHLTETTANKQGKKRKFQLPDGVIIVHERNLAAFARMRFAFFFMFWLVIACSGGGDGAPIPLPLAAAQTVTVAPTPQPAPASVNTMLEVPAALAAAPFDAAHSLIIPPGFGIRLWARVDKARFMALRPDGDILVSVPDQGKIVLLRERANDVPQSFDFVTGLRKPHDMVFHTIGNTTYLYISESNRVSRAVYVPGATALGEREVVVDNLPDSSSPGLGGAYGHELKNIAFGPDDKLYVSIASNCNVCAEDTQADPVRGSVYQYSADGTNGRLFARGLRNAEGLDFLPGTNTLWVAVNNRDQIPVPLDIDVDGDGTSDFGKVIPAYVDDNPSELFTPLRDGGNYGWPFCNQVPNATMSNLELLPDYDTNRGGAAFDCSSADRPAKGIAAHSAPLGFSFLHNSNVPVAYRRGAIIALHGCWDCTVLKAGYKAIYFPFDDAANAGAEMDLVTGFVTDPVARSLWGRPVDAIADAHGNILISDDFAGAIYQLYPK
jgi:glucose/arabinose dehydrogenase